MASKHLWITPNHQSVSGSIPHSRVINVSGSPQIASQWILDPCLHRPELLAEMSISQAKKNPQSSSWWSWCRCCLNLVNICCVLTDLTNFGRPEQFLSFAWVLLRLNVIFWWYLKTMIIRFKSAREITNKVTDNKILLQIAFQVLLWFLPRRTRRGSISIWWQPCLN